MVRKSGPEEHGQKSISQCSRGCRAGSNNQGYLICSGQKPKSRRLWEKLIRVAASQFQWHPEGQLKSNEVQHLQRRGPGDDLEGVESESDEMGFTWELLQY